MRTDEGVWCCRHCVDVGWGVWRLRNEEGAATRFEVLRSKNSLLQSPLRVYTGVKA